MDDSGLCYWQTVGQWEMLEVEQDPQYQAWIEAQEQEWRNELEPA